MNPPLVWTVLGIIVGVLLVALGLAWRRERHTTSEPDRLHLPSALLLELAVVTAATSNLLLNQVVRAPTLTAAPDEKLLLVEAVIATVGTACAGAALHVARRLRVRGSNRARTTGWTAYGLGAIALLALADTALRIGQDINLGIVTVLSGPVLTALIIAVLATRGLALLATRPQAIATSLVETHPDDSSTQPAPAPENDPNPTAHWDQYRRPL